MVAAAFCRCRSHSRRAGCRGCGAGVTTQTARASGVRLRPPGAINENALPVPVCVAVSVFRLALTTPKTGDAGFWPVGGHAIFCRTGIPCEMCEDIPCAKVCPSGARIVRLNRSTTRGWGWRYWWTGKLSQLSGAALRCLLSRMPEIDEAITLELERNTRTGKHAPFCRRFTATPVPVAVSAKKYRAGTTGNQGVTAVTGERGVSHHYRFGWLEGNNGKS